MIFFILGLLDILGGAILIFSPSVLFGLFAKYLGVILLIKGVYSIITDTYSMIANLT